MSGGRAGHRLIVTAACASVACCLAYGAPSAEPAVATKPILTLALAKLVVATAETEAVRGRAPCVIAVVDDGGWLVMQERMDDSAMLASVELAPGKARAAALYRKPTSELEGAINGGRIAAVTAPGFTQMDGGVPLVVHGVVIGAIGVSSDTPAHDLEISQAGANAIR